MSDRQRVDNELPIRRPRKKHYMKNDARLQKCCVKYDNGMYTCMQFLRAVSHSIVHIQPLQIPDNDNHVTDDADTDHDTIFACRWRRERRRLCRHL